MAGLSSSDVGILAVGIVVAAVYLFKDQLFASKPKSTPMPAAKLAAGGGDPRDFIAKMKEAVSTMRSSFAST
jgi:NADPH-ferrihemoprotein reductase